MDFFKLLFSMTQRPKFRNFKSIFQGLNIYFFQVLKGRKLGFLNQFFQGLNIHFLQRLKLWIWIL